MVERNHGKVDVGSPILPPGSGSFILRGWQSGQLHQTVNLAPSGYAGSNPAPRTKIFFSNYFENTAFVQAW